MPPNKACTDEVGSLRHLRQAFFGCRACRDTGFGFFLLPNRVHARPADGQRSPLDNLSLKATRCDYKERVFL